MAKTVLVTGGAGGIGAAVVTRFAAEGYQVVLHYHTATQAAEALQRRLTAQGCNVAALAADVTDTAQVNALVEETVRLFGGLDVLVNNAGIAEQALFTDITDAAWERMLAVNLGGVFRCCRAAVPHMVRQKSGSIINISSMWGICGASCEVHYSAAKAGVIGLTKALAKELGPSNVRVNCVAPGVIDTPMNAALDEAALQALREETPLERIGRPEDIADSVFFLAEQAGFVTGQVLSPNGGLVI